MERYASVHNPSSSSSKFQEKKAKFGLKTPRNVSIPDTRSNMKQELEEMCIKGATGPKKAMFSSATSWKNKGDLARINNLKNDNMKAKTSLTFSPDVINGEKREKNLKVNGHDKENDTSKVPSFDQENGEDGEEEEDGNSYVVRETMSDNGRKSVTQAS